MATVILGTGIIGTATAYYLSKTEMTPGSIHLVEPAAELFSSASGFAGGFLSKDWFSGPMRTLAELSFEEHRAFAAEHEGATKWGYRSGAAFSYEWPEGAGGKSGANWLLEGTSRSGAAGDGQKPLNTEDVSPSWQRRYPGDSIECIALDTVAQVDPMALSQVLLKECLSLGVKLHHPAKAISVQADTQGELASIRIINTTTSAETDLPCTRVIIAAGCWSPEVFKTLFPSSGMSLPITSLSGHSLLVKLPRLSQPLAANERSHAIFASKVDGHAPEAFSWGDGSIYVAGLNDAAYPLPNLPSDSKKQMSAEYLALLKGIARKMLGCLGTTGKGEEASNDADDLEVVREALCFRPVTGLGRPFICRIPDGQLGGGIVTRPGAGGGVFLASGHGPWGISLSLGTGKVMAELVRGQPSSLGEDLPAFLLTAPTLEHTYNRRRTSGA